MSTHARQPAGSPRGGQFATTGRAESNVDLGGGEPAADEPIVPSSVVPHRGAGTGNGFERGESLTKGGRMMMSALMGAGLRGKAREMPTDDPSVTRVEVDLESGDKMVVESDSNATTFAVWPKPDSVTRQPSTTVTELGRAGLPHYPTRVREVLTAAAMTQELNRAFPSAQKNGTLQGVRRNGSNMLSLQDKDASQYSALIRTNHAGEVFLGVGSESVNPDGAVGKIVAQDMISRLGRPGRGSGIPRFDKNDPVKSLSSALNTVVDKSLTHPMVADNLRF